MRQRAEGIKLPFLGASSETHKMAPSKEWEPKGELKALPTLTLNKTELYIQPMLLGLLWPFLVSLRGYYQPQNAKG